MEKNRITEKKIEKILNPVAARRGEYTDTVAERCSLDPHAVIFTANHYTLAASPWSKADIIRRRMLASS